MFDKRADSSIQLIVYIIRGSVFLYRQGGLAVGTGFRLVRGLDKIIYNKIL